MGGMKPLTTFIENHFEEPGIHGNTCQRCANQGKVSLLGQSSTAVATARQDRHVPYPSSLPTHNQRRLPDYIARGRVPSKGATIVHTTLVVSLAPPCLVGGGEFVVVSWVSRLPHHRRLVVVPRCSNGIPLGSCQLFADEDRTFAAPRRIDKGLPLYREHVSDAHLMSTGGVAASETDTVVLSFPPLNR